MPEKENWDNRWLKGDTPWSYPEADQEFYSDFAQVMKHIENPDVLNALVPLSGDSLAVRFLYDQGFNVSAVEFSETAVESLKNKHFSENKFAITAEKHSAERIEIYNSDFFKFQTEKSYDLIYDRAAFVAIDRKDRENYIKRLEELCKPGGLLYITLFEWENNEEYGPPYNSPISIVKPMLKNFTELFSKRIKENNVSEKMLNAGINYFDYTHTIFKKIKI